MKTITIENLQENFDSYLERVENGESFMITSPNGNVVMTPAKVTEEIDDLIRIHTDHEEGC